MGLLQILNGEQDFSFYGGGISPNPNAVSSPVSFGQKTIGYNNGAFIPKSQKPYITTPIPDQGISFRDQNPPLFSLPGFDDGLPGVKQLNQLTDTIRYQSDTWGQDFLNRGNLYGLVRAKDDLKRLTSYYLDGTKGLLFIAKQNLLSRVGTGFGSETKKSVSNALGLIKEGVYLPTSTLAQAAVSGVGGHLLKQGIDPTGKIPLLKLPKYEDVNNKKIKKNRLVKILDTHTKRFNKNKIESYGGGPGSVLGIGRTKIRYATDSEGKNKVSSIISNKSLISKFGNFSTWDNQDFNKDRIFDVFFNQKLPIKNSETLGDFRERLVKPNNQLKTSTFLSLSPNYKDFNIEKRLNYRSGGTKGNILDYTKGKRDVNGNIIDSDLINLSSIYKDIKASTDPQLKDIIDFRIGVFDNKSIGKKEVIDKYWLHFRAFLEGFDDSYKASWKSQEYMGRAEKFYRYNSFDRDISLSFNLVAFSKQELIPIYKKLNYLASHLAPSYSNAGYMSGNLIQLTVGNYLWEQPGFIESISIKVDDDTPWEINLGLDGEEESQKITQDKTSIIVKQVPHRVKVSMKFTPIHRFRPQIQELNNTKEYPEFGTNDNTFGNQKYIALQSNEDPNQVDGYNPIKRIDIDPSTIPSTANDNQLSLAQIRETPSALQQEIQNQINFNDLMETLSNAGLTY